MAHSSFRDIPDIRLFRLNLEYNYKSFNCGNKQLNDFLFNQSKAFQQHLLYVTYLLEASERIVAYYSLSNDVLRISASSSKEFKSLLRKRVKSDLVYNLFGWCEFPAVKICRFAIDDDYQGKGYGTELLEGLIYSFVHENKTGCAFITVDAIKTPRVIKFYKRNRFELLTSNDEHKDSRLMYRCLL